MEITIITAMVIGLTEVIKKTGKVNEKYLPLAVITLGILLSYGSGIKGTEGLYTGTIVGLMAMGLWSGSKTVIKK